jgi:predicted lipoprotein with Yx(FWY)xxD motif
MLKSLVHTALIAVSLSAASVAFAQAMAPAKTADTSKGKTFVDAKGMTLYTFDKDVGGKSACNGPCATSWPPFMAVAGSKASGDWTLVTRDDGSSQWAYKGKPLSMPGVRTPNPATCRATASSMAPGTSPNPERGALPRT